MAAAEPEVIHLTDSDSDAPADSIPEGITVRGWYGVKLVGGQCSLAIYIC